jgi:uncharacterized FlaG/YvyC family protein
VDIQKQGNESQENRYITEEDTETTKWTWRAVQQTEKKTKEIKKEINEIKKTVKDMKEEMNKDMQSLKKTEWNRSPRNKKFLKSNKKNTI